MKSSSPKKGGACAVHAPDSQKQLFTSSHSYQRCSHSAKKIERLPQGHTHYARTIERQRNNSFRLAKLAMAEGLSDWERSFVCHVSARRQKLLSNAEQRTLDLLIAKYLLEGKHGWR